MGFLESQDIGVQGSLTYGPWMHGVKPRRTAYNHYRTDFPLEGAWLFLSRLVHDSIRPILHQNLLYTWSLAATHLVGEPSLNSAPNDNNDYSLLFPIDNHQISFCNSQSILSMWKLFATHHLKLLKKHEVNYHVLNPILMRLLTHQHHFPTWMQIIFPPLVRRPNFLQIRPILLLILLLQRWAHLFRNLIIKKTLGHVLIQASDCHYRELF